MWVPFLRSFPGNEAHKLFSGGPKWGFRVGGKKFMLKKFVCFFRPLVNHACSPKEKTPEFTQKWAGECLTPPLLTPG